jgi:hypothetical protein
VLAESEFLAVLSLIDDGTVISVISQSLEVAIDESVYGAVVTWVILCAHILLLLWLYFFLGQPAGWVVIPTSLISSYAVL